jgi:hypothetical protein
VPEVNDGVEDLTVRSSVVSGKVVPVPVATVVIRGVNDWKRIRREVRLQDILGEGVDCTPIPRRPGINIANLRLKAARLSEGRASTRHCATSTRSIVTLVVWNSS